MRITLISDTHTKHESLKLPGGDMVICAGDVSNRGSFEDLRSFFGWYSKLDYVYKICTAGNHDFFFESGEVGLSVDRFLKDYDNIIYLENSSVTIEGIKIYGSPYTHRFYNWAFNVDRGNPIAEQWAKIPMDTDILITHGPPLGHGDKTISGERVGCADLLKRVEIVKPILHVFGHIHEGYGMYGSGKDTTFINCSSVDEYYYPVNQPITIDYENFL